MGIIKALALMGQVGLSVVLPLVFFIWLGQLLARRVGGDLPILVTSILLGLTIGFTQIYRLLFKGS